MKRGRAGFAQKRERARADERGKSGRDTHTAIADRVGVFHSISNPPLPFLSPLSINRQKPFGLAHSLRRLHRDRRELFVWKITAARAKIGAGIAQNVDQLQTHSVTLRQVEHFRFAMARELWQMSKTKPRPKFSGAAGDEVSVFIELGRGFERDDPLWIW